MDLPSCENDGDWVTGGRVVVDIVMVEEDDRKHGKVDSSDQLH